MSHSQIVPAFFVAVALSAAPGAVAADVALGATPDGFGGIAFGASGEDLRGTFPAAQRLGSPAGSVGDAGVPDPTTAIEMYQLAKFPIEALGECNVVFHTYFDHLAKIDFYCLDKDKVGPYLEERYGPATSLLGQAKLWDGENQIVHTPHLGTFSFTNRKQQEELQAKLVDHYLRQSEADRPERTPAAPREAR